MGIREGAILAGKYRVERLIGVGGMGLVVAARHLQLDERVAVKLMLPETLGNADAVARFTREARAAAKIKGENVARVFDIGTLENGAPHRDLKPANLFCVRRHDGQLTIKVLDFGISKLTDTAGSLSRATKTNVVMGSPHYMSPEQMQSAKDVDARTDLWALGVVLYELVTGALPFGGDSYAEVAIKVATQPAPPLRLLRPDAPAGLETAVLKCLQKDRGQRYRHVGEFADALVDFAPNRKRRSAERVPESTLLEPKAFPETIPPVGITTFGRKRRGATLGVGAVAAAVLLAGGFAAWRAPWIHTGAANAMSARPGSPTPPSSTAPGANVSAPGDNGGQEPFVQSAEARPLAEPSVTGPMPSGTTRSVGASTPAATALPATGPIPPATSPPAITAAAKHHPPAHPVEPSLSRAPSEKVAPAATSGAVVPVRGAAPPAGQPSAATPSNALDVPLMR